MNKELLTVIEAVSNEKSLRPESVFKTLETAIALAIKKKFSKEVEIVASLDRKTGEVTAFRRWKIVEEVKQPELEMDLETIRSLNLSGEVGEYHEELLPQQGFDRITTQLAKQVIVQRLREAEKEALLEDFSSKVGRLVFGTVKEIHKDGFIVDIGNRAEAFLPKSKMLPSERFRAGDRVRAILFAHREESLRRVFQLSRICQEMLMELLRVEVPEIGEGVIEIKGVARDPGIRSKLAVVSKDKRVDPIGACVGMRGSRIQAISSELNGERLDVVIWDEDPIQFVVNAMSPTEVSSIIMDEDEQSMDIAVPESTLAQAIGKNGKNVKLASQLTGWKLNILGEKTFSEQADEGEVKVRQALTQQLGVEGALLESLLEEGLSTLEVIASLSEEELSGFEGIPEETMRSLWEKAKQLLEEAEQKELEAWMQLLQANIGARFSITSQAAKELRALKFDSLEKLADASLEELEAVSSLTEEQKGSLIMAAREKCWFTSD